MNPPSTNRSTGAQGDGNGDDKPMGGPRMAPPLRPQRGTSADDGSAGTPTRRTSGTDGARPEHGTLERHEYGLMVPTGTAVYPADAAEPGSEAGHGVTGEQDVRNPEEGDETQQRALPARDRSGVGDKGRGPPERSRA